MKKIFKNLKHRRLWAVIIMGITWLSLKFDWGLDLSDTGAITDLIIKMVEYAEVIFETAGVLASTVLNFWSLIKPKK